MSEAAEKLKPVLAALSAEDRQELTRYLLELDDPVDPADGISDSEWHAAWEAELERRADAVDSGAVSGRPVDEVMRELRDRFR